MCHKYMQWYNAELIGYPRDTSVSADAWRCPRESCNAKTYISQNASVISPEKCRACRVVRGCHGAGWWRVFMRAQRGPGLLILRDQEHSWIRSCLLGWWNPLVICHSSNMESQLHPCGKPRDMLLAFQESHTCCLHVCVCVYGWRNRQRSRLISHTQPWHS